jgi:hypothetical protein
MKRPPQILAAILGASALAIFPLLAPTYYVGLMIPFFAYAIALLGFNLLFGYAGLLSFGHAMFIGFGAYGTAVMAGVFGVKSFELVLAARLCHRCDPDRLCVRALYRHFLRHVDTRLRHAVPLVPVQILLHHWRRQWHAHPAHEHP